MYACVCAAARSAESAGLGVVKRTSMRSVPRTSRTRGDIVGENRDQLADEFIRIEIAGESVPRRIRVNEIFEPAVAQGQHVALDDLDSKMESMRAHFEREAGTENAWTGYNASLGRPLLNTTKFLEKKPAGAPVSREDSGHSTSGADTPTLPGLDLDSNGSRPVPAAARAEKS